MSVQRRKYSKDFKMQILEAVLLDESLLVLAKENNLNPNLIHRWKRKYLEGSYLEEDSNGQKLKKLKTRICELKQMVGKLTMENYILKKEKQFMAKAKKESSSQVTGANLDQFRRQSG